MGNYGGFWIRVAAYLIDTVVLMVAQWMVFAAFGVSVFGVTSLDPDAGELFSTSGGLIAYAITTIGAILYFVLMESSAKQGTLGKMALGLIVTDYNGNRITWLRALGRYFAKILSGIILLIGYIMIAFTDRKQGLHDLICSTLVLKAAPGQTGVDPSVFD
jgi:uncharacterized RDD family membrane protein YckC